MDETIGLDNLDPPPEQELEDDDNYVETNVDDDSPNTRWHTARSNFDEDNEDDITSLINPRNREEFEDMQRIFGDRAVEANIALKFFDDIDIPHEYKNLRFIKYIMDKHNFSIEMTPNTETFSKDYDITYYGRLQFNEDGTGRIRLAREFTIEDNEFGNDAEYQQFTGDFQYLYDKWKAEDTKKRIKKAGIVGGVLISVGGLITGLALGLKRSGHSMVHDRKMKWKKLTPAEKKQIVIPWTKLEEASGRGAIIVGDYIYVIIGGTILVYAFSK